MADWNSPAGLPAISVVMLAFVGSVMAGCTSEPLFDDDPAVDATDLTDDGVTEPGTDEPSDGTEATDVGTEEPATDGTETDEGTEMGPEPTDGETDPVMTDEPDGGTDVEPADPDAGAGDVRLLNTIPEHEAVDVDPGVTVVLEFDRAVVPGAGAIVLLEALNESVVESIDVQEAERIEFDDDTVRIDWLTVLASSTSYAVVVEAGAIVGVGGAPFPGLRDSGELLFSTGEPRTLTLEATNPSDGDSDVELDADITLVFSEPVQAGLGTLSVFDSNGDEAVAVQSILLGDANQVDIDGPLVTVDLPADLRYGADYYVVLEPDAILSLAGAGFPGFGEGVLSFSTVPPPEVSLIATSPMDNATDVDPDTALVFTFNDDVVAGEGVVSVYESAGDTLAASVDVADTAVQFTADTMTVQLPSTLQDATGYYVNVDAGAVSSKVGGVYGGLSGSTALSFTTADTPPPPMLVEATVPVAGAVDVSVGTDLTIEFSEDVRLGSGNISIYADGAADPLEVVSVMSTQVTLSGNSVTIDLDRTLNGNTTYYVLVTAGSFESVSGASFMGINDPAVFRFTTENTFSLVSLSPVDGATGVEPGTNLVLTFSEDVELDAGSIEVRLSSGGALLESVSVGDGKVVASGTQVTVDLDHLMAGETGYYVLLEDGVVMQAGGSAVYEGISTPTEWNFTTDGVAFTGNVSAGLVLWVDGAYAPSFKTAPGVSLWADRSGQNNDLKQNTSSQRPQRAPGAIGGLEAVRFDGGNDWLVASQGFSFTAVEGFIVWQSPVAFSTTEKQSLLVNGSNLEVNYSHPAGAAHAVATYATNGWFNGFFEPPPTADDAYLWNFGFASITTSVFASVNGGAHNYNSAPTAAPVAAEFPLALGGTPDGCAAHAGCYFEGDIGEVLLFSRQLSQAERLAVTDELRDKWSLDQPVCGGGETRGANGRCYFLGTSATNWYAARDACANRGRGWSLATVRSALDNSVVSGVLGSTVSDAWIGASDVEVPDTWRWINDTLHFWSGGSSANGGGPANGSYSNWRPGEPSRGDVEACARYNFFESAWTWADGGCDDGHPYLCEGPGN